MLFFPLINVKMPTIVGILTFIGRKNFMLSRVEHEKSFITSGPGILSCLYCSSYWCAMILTSISHFVLKFWLKSWENGTFLLTSVVK